MNSVSTTSRRLPPGILDFTRAATQVHWASIELARSNHWSSGRLTRDHVLKICDLRNDDEEVFMLPPYICGRRRSLVIQTLLLTPEKIRKWQECF